MTRKITGIVAASVTIFLGLTACGQKSHDNDNADTMIITEDTLGLNDSTVDTVTDTATEIILIENDGEGGATADYTTTASGLKYKVIKQGNGKKPKATDNVTVHYTGRLLNGEVFDSSVSRGEPATFPLNRVIAGWTEGVQLMPEGSVYEFYIPYNLAYGESGAGPIPPKSDLIFKVELIKVQ